MGVPKDAAQDEIKKAFLILAKKYHPDVNSAKDAARKFSDINEAYETLYNETKRNLYNETGMTANE